MRKWDEELLKYSKQPLFYKRSIDDGFGIWCGSVEELKGFAKHANNKHYDIKVDLTMYTRQIDFLDTLVKMEDGKIYTDLYAKPIDKHLYLNSKSCHPPSTKKGLVFGLGLRLKRICKKPLDYDYQRRILIKKLRQRDYSGKTINSQTAKVNKLDRGELLKNESVEKNQTVPLTVTYSNLLPDLNHVIRKHTKILYKSERMTKVF